MISLLPDDEVKANVPSDPFLMYGFDKKSPHLWHDANEPVSFKIEVDVIGNGQFKVYETKTVGVGDFLFEEKIERGRTTDFVA